jgi:hypothetical protein
LLQIVAVSAAKKRMKALRIVAWCVFATVLAWNFYLGTRSGVILLVGGAISAVYIPRRKNPSFLFLGMIFVALFAVVHFQERYRSEFYGLQINMQNYSVDDVYSTVVPTVGASTAQTASAERGMDISCATATVLLVPDVVDYNWGYPFLELVTRWIPRSMWADKPYPLYEAITPIFAEADLSNSWYTDSAKPILVGPALTFVGHWWAMGGLIGVILAAFATGIFLAQIDSLLWDPRHGFGGGVLLMLLSVIGFLEAAATPTVWVFSVPFYALPVCVLLLAVRRRSGRKPGSGRSMPVRAQST